MITRLSFEKMLPKNPPFARRPRQGTPSGTPTAPPRTSGSDPKCSTWSEERWVAGGKKLPKMDLPIKNGGSFH